MDYQHQFQVQGSEFPLIVEWEIDYTRTRILHNNLVIGEIDGKSDLVSGKSIYYEPLGTIIIKLKQQPDQITLTVEDVTYSNQPNRSSIKFVILAANFILPCLFSFLISYSLYSSDPNRRLSLTDGLKLSSLIFFISGIIYFISILLLMRKRIEAYFVGSVLYIGHITWFVYIALLPNTSLNALGWLFSGIFTIQLFSILFFLRRSISYYKKSVRSKNEDSLIDEHI